MCRSASTERLQRASRHAETHGHRQRRLTEALRENRSPEAPRGQPVSQRFQGSPTPSARSTAVVRAPPKPLTETGPVFRDRRPADGRQPLRQGRLRAGARPLRPAAGLRPQGPHRGGGLRRSSSSWTSAISWG
ncbi:MAG: hypothetical protein MZV70_07370 [Desulfobacterales bacterium]|nr:hypothetical protein [Desulfobacterales bacterium]